MKQKKILVKLAFFRFNISLLNLLINQHSMIKKKTLIFQLLWLALPQKPLKPGPPKWKSSVLSTWPDLEVVLKLLAKTK